MNRKDPTVTDLRMALQLLPTPTANDYKSAGYQKQPKGRVAPTLPGVVGGAKIDETKSTKPIIPTGDPVILPHEQTLARGLGWGPSVQAWAQYGESVARWELIVGRAAPPPLSDGRLNPDAVEWMMGLPAGWVTDRGLSRAQALKILGNGVVPQQAAEAVRRLSERIPG